MCTLNTPAQLFSCVCMDLTIVCYFLTIPFLILFRYFKQNVQCIALLIMLLFSLQNFKSPSMLFCILDSCGQGELPEWEQLKLFSISRDLPKTRVSIVSTHMPGFSYFSVFLSSFCVGQISHQQYNGKGYPAFQEACLRLE